MLVGVPESTIFEWIPPMKATIGLPADETGWATELKWDGLRTEVLTDGETTVLRSSRGRDITAQFPELADFGSHLGAPAVLDGELVVFDGDRPSFQRVLQRLNTERPNQQLIAENPAVYIAFDLLVLDGNRLLDLPFETRRRILADFLSDGPSWRVPPYGVDGSGPLLALARERDLEGVVVKRLASAYRPGARSSDWRKVKIRLRQEFVVGGWLAGQGSLEDGIGSLVLGVWDGPDLVMAGLAGSGLTDDARRRLAGGFTERDTPPFVAVPPLPRRATWVEPTTVVEVEFGDWPAEGMLRHPVYLGIRDDKDPTDVVREIEPPGGGRSGDA
jgi:bifunctional non-homologous end joining protein LigD